jgi:hypothetical protein
LVIGDTEVPVEKLAYLAAKIPGIEMLFPVESTVILVGPNVVEGGVVPLC